MSAGSRKARTLYDLPTDADGTVYGAATSPSGEWIGLGELSRQELVRAASMRFPGRVSGSAWLRCSKVELVDAVRSGVLPARLEGEPVPDRSPKPRKPRRAAIDAGELLPVLERIAVALEALAGTRAPDPEPAPIPEPVAASKPVADEVSKA